ncbi:MAG: aminotransferase class IV, partial [Rubricella sp.]
GLRLCLSSFRRPSPDTALTEAKAACLYPNNGRMVAEARAKGFDNAISLDQHGHVAETASTNVFVVKDGAVRTPAPNGTFLAGITRARVIDLLRKDGMQVEEVTMLPGELDAADEIFLTGNAAKVMPVIGWEDRAMQPGPVAARARALYWDYAHGRIA